MPPSTRTLELPVDDPMVEAVSAVVHRPARASGLAVLLAPGAGGTLDTPGLVALADLVARAGHTAVRVNLPYRQAGRGGAPRADRTVAPYREVARRAAAAVEADGWVVGGKSYGGRVATMAVAAGHEARGVLCYGYPLHPPGRPERVRVEHWPQVDAPVLLVQGARDTFGAPEEYRPHLGKFPRRSSLLVVEGGDHSCKVAAKNAPDGRARNEAAALGEHADAIGRWLDGLA